MIFVKSLAHDFSPAVFIQYVSVISLMQIEGFPLIGKFKFEFSKISSPISLPRKTTKALFGDVRELSNLCFTSENCVFEVMIFPRNFHIFSDFDSLKIVVPTLNIRKTLRHVQFFKFPKFCSHINNSFNICKKLFLHQSPK